MRRGTTPTIQLRLNADVTGYNCHMVVLDETGTTIHLGDDRLTKTPTMVTAILTQEETLSLHGHRVYVQMRAYDESGMPATATQIMVDALLDDLIGEITQEEQNNG